MELILQMMIIHVHIILMSREFLVADVIVSNELVLRDMVSVRNVLQRYMNISIRFRDDLKPEALYMMISRRAD